MLPDAAPGLSNLPACTNGYHRFVYLDFYALEPHFTKRFNRKKRDYSDKASRKVGTRSALYILLLISALILIREAFSITTVNNAEKQSNGHFWYLLIALSEILAVVLYSTRFNPCSLRTSEGHEWKEVTLCFRVIFSTRATCPFNSYKLWIFQRTCPA